MQCELNTGDELQRKYRYSQDMVRELYEVINVKQLESFLYLTGASTVIKQNLTMGEQLRKRPVLFIGIKCNSVKIILTT